MNGHQTVLNKQIIYVTGLPRAGSTLLCQLLGHHPQIYSIHHSSPLCGTLEHIRRYLSDEPFLLSQLDVDFELTYQRMLNAYRGFFEGWFKETDECWVVDKNRGWLGMIETLNVIDPNFKMLVCLRDLRAIYGSVEAQHQKTLLLDFPDHLAPNSAYRRADILFKEDGVIGGPLKSLENLQDILDEPLKQKLSYITFEGLIQNPVQVMNTIYQWLGLPTIDFDPTHLQNKSHESDSYYRFKYRHKTYTAIKPPTKHTISPRIEQEILKNYRWYYDYFYSSISSDLNQVE